MYRKSDKIFLFVRIQVVYKKYVRVEMKSYVNFIHGKSKDFIYNKTKLKKSSRADTHSTKRKKLVFLLLKNNHAIIFTFSNAV